MKIKLIIAFCLLMLVNESDLFAQKKIDLTKLEPLHKVNYDSNHIKPKLQSVFDTLNWELKESSFLDFYSLSYTLSEDLSFESATIYVVKSNDEVEEISLNVDEFSTEMQQKIRTAKTVTFVSIKFKLKGSPYLRRAPGIIFKNGFMYPSAYIIDLNKVEQIVEHKKVNKRTIESSIWKVVGGKQHKKEIQFPLGQIDKNELPHDAKFFKVKLKMKDEIVKLKIKI